MAEIVVENDREGLLDAVTAVSVSFDKFVLDHPMVCDNPELRREAAALSEILGDFYQKVGSFGYN